MVGSMTIGCPFVGIDMSGYIKCMTVKSELLPQLPYPRLDSRMITKEVRSAFINSEITLAHNEAGTKDIISKDEYGMQCIVCITM